MSTNFTYSTESKRYHDNDTGRFLGRVEVRKVLDDIIDRSALSLSGVTDELRYGEISLADWQTTMELEIKNIHLSFATIANGGFDNMTNESWNRVESYITEQYDYLQNFAEEIYTGEQLPDGTMLNRAKLYSESGRVTYENEKRIIEIESGAKQEKNILGGADHCKDCIEMTLAGWVEVNSLIPIGLRICQAKCHCTIIFRINSKDKLGSEEESFNE